MARLLLQRGYLMGLRRARAKAQRERDEMADRFEDVVGEIRAEMRDFRDELVRLKMIESAIEIGRDPQIWLN